MSELEFDKKFSRPKSETTKSELELLSKTIQFSRDFVQTDLVLEPTGHFLSTTDTLVHFSFHTVEVMTYFFIITYLFAFLLR